MKVKLNSDSARLVGRIARGLVTALSVLILLLALSATAARAASTIVVGNGTPESCTTDAFVQALAAVPAGGTITFNCGPNPVTIIVSDGEIYKDLTIDGGGLITFTGYNTFYIGAGTVKLMNLSVSGATGDDTGGIDNRSTLTLTHVTVSYNSSGHGTSGGGIFNWGTMTLEDSTIIGNSAGCDQVQCGSGGGISNGGTLRVVNTTISGNSAASGGGGIDNWGTATIENSTIVGNGTGCIVYGYDTQVCYSGGGILNSGTIEVINSTVSNNTAPTGGGLANGNSATLQNSILAGNKDANNQPSDCSGTLTSQGYNLLRSTAGCTITGSTTGNLLGVDPLLGPLQDNGGPTLTQALLPGSPAIDAGNPATPGSGGTACEATDQRGVLRPQDGNGDGIARCDIGAVEMAPSTLTVTIDIKPGDATNPINLKSKGVIPVAILSTSTFNAQNVVPASVKFGPSGALSTSNSFEDVNGDGRLDLVLHFRAQQTGIQPADRQACLVGKTRSGSPIRGCDGIRVVPR